MQSLRGLGHEGVLLTRAPAEGSGADAAIVNLGQTEPNPTELISVLQGLGIPVIAHSGHKETALRDVGKRAGVEVLATNSELTHKLGEILERIHKRVIQ